MTDNGGGNYTISDAYGGLYRLWYDIYDIQEEHSGTFNDICGIISGSFTEPFDKSVTYSGSVNPANGILTISWITGYGDKATMVLTKK